MYHPWKSVPLHSIARRSNSMLSSRQRWVSLLVIWCGCRQGELAEPDESCGRDLREVVDGSDHIGSWSVSGSVVPRL
jgi:hypothetical protein